MASSFLGVDASLTGRAWVGPSIEVERLAEAIAQQTTLPDMVTRLLARRGVSPDMAQTYLNPTLRDLMPDPSGFLDMDKAADRIVAAVRNRQRIAIFADYDVDGGTSSALLQNWLNAQGLRATLYVPDRLTEGYGPNDTAMKMLGESHDLVICVDCGTLAHGPIAVANQAGADVIVLDHHQADETLPPALAVVNPNRQDETSEYTYLCAAGVVFMALAAANRLLRAQNLPEPPLLPLLDLVALGTVADVAPLVGFNRALVRQGLAVMARRKHAGLVALADVAGMKSTPSAFHLGFLLGPRLNAGGRVGKSDLGARLLACSDPVQARDLAAQLDDLNKTRREIEAQVQAEALLQVETRDTTGPLVWAAGQGWHPGVVGIVASRLKEKYNRPAVVIGVNDGVGLGSGRSVTGIDLGVAVAALMRGGQISKGGGHAMAAGLTVPEDAIEPAMQALSERLAKQGADRLGAADLKVDGVLGSGAATVELIEQLQQVGPFGAASPAPRFVIPSALIKFAKPAGESHLRLTIDNGGGRLDVIAFRAFETALGPALLNHSGAPFHFAGRLEVDEWGGRRKAKLQLEDAALVG